MTVVNRLPRTSRAAELSTRIITMGDFIVSHMTSDVMLVVRVEKHGEEFIQFFGVCVNSGRPMTIPVNVNDLELVVI